MLKFVEYLDVRKEVLKDELIDMKMNNLCSW